MINSSTSDRIIECWCPHNELPDLSKSNYYVGDPINGITFYEDNNNDIEYVPVQQSSFIIDQDTATVYSYIIDSNPNSLRGQTGHWKILG